MKFLDFKKRAYIIYDNNRFKSKMANDILQNIYYNWFDKEKEEFLRYKLLLKKFYISI